MKEAAWFELSNIQEVDSPALVLYIDRIKENINRLVKSIDDPQRLRPHVKTHKSAEVTRLMLQSGISKFKCATIAEAEMLASAGVNDILLAYQPVGPKIPRLISLIRKFPQVTFSCLVDNINTAHELNSALRAEKLIVSVYVDLNVGMNRTGITPEEAFDLCEALTTLPSLQLTGLHAYDGHLRDSDFNDRKKKCDLAFGRVETLSQKLKGIGKQVIIVAGGTPTFSIHCQRKEVECSPGTFIYWDKGYENILPEQHYLHAALVVTRVISKPAPGKICVDLGHKAIASENPLTHRVYFLNAPDVTPAGHSEEHMVLDTAADFSVGDVLYGVPYHVCPTIALHDYAHVVENNQVTTTWKTLSRSRRITL